MDKVFDMAQEKELTFWEHWSRSVRAHYKDPSDYVRYRFRDTLFERGLTEEDFRDKCVVEIGPGMFPMVSILPVLCATVVEPLLPKFDKLLTRAERQLWSGLEVLEIRGEDFRPAIDYDYCILKNVLDHTTRPQDIVSHINARIVLVDSFVNRREDTTLHPSAFLSSDAIESLFSGFKCVHHSINEQLHNHYFTFEKNQ